MPGLPMTALVLALATAASATAQTTAPAKPPADTPPARKPVSDLPDGKALLAEAVEAAGGAKAFKDVKSVHVNLTVDGTNPVSYDIYTAGPTKAYVLIDANGMQFKMGRNGEIAWLELGAARKIEPSQVEEAANPARLSFAWQTAATRYKTVETVGSVMIGEDDCWRIRLADPIKPDATVGTADRYIALSKRTKLPARFENPLANGARSIISVYDYKKFGELHFYTSIDLLQGGSRQRFKITKIDLNNVDDEIFTPPASVAGSTSQPSGTTQPGGA